MNKNLFYVVFVLSFCFKLICKCWWIILLAFVVGFYIGYKDISNVKEQEVQKAPTEFIGPPQDPELGVLTQFRRNLPRRTWEKIPGVQKVNYGPAITIWHGGKQGIDEVKLRQTIRFVLAEMAIVKVDENLVDLIVETAATESHFGKIVKQKKGPARGIFQIEPATIRDMNRWLEGRPVTKRLITSYYDRKKSEVWNWERNLKWQIAMTAAMYWRHMGDNLPKYIKTREQRAFIYKIFWNTLDGKGSRNKFMRDCQTYLKV